MSVMHASSPVSPCTLVLFLQHVLVSCSLLWDLCPRSDRAAPRHSAGWEGFSQAHTLGARCPSNVPAKPQERLGNISRILGMFGARLVSAFVSKKCEGLFAWKHFFGTASLTGTRIPSLVSFISSSNLHPSAGEPQRAACLLFTKLTSMCKWCLTPAPKRTSSYVQNVFRKSFGHVQTVASWTSASL